LGGRAWTRVGEITGGPTKLAVFEQKTEVVAENSKGECVASQQKVSIRKKRKRHKNCEMGS